MYLRRALLALLVVIAACGDVHTVETDRLAPSPIAVRDPIPRRQSAPGAAIARWQAQLRWDAVVAWNAEVERQSERASTVTRTPPRPAPARPKPAPPVTAPSYGGHGGSGVPRNATERCILERENGGSYARGTNPSHFGAFQFSRGTWVANGGNPATWGSAGKAEQDAVFITTVARNGYRDWTPYDGC